MLKIGDVVQWIHPNQGLPKGAKGHILDISSGNYVVEWFDLVRRGNELTTEILEQHKSLHRIKLCEDDCHSCLDRYLCFKARLKFITNQEKKLYQTQVT